jgi:DNA-binding transcriptional MerR regulator
VTDAAEHAPAGRRGDKSAAAFRTISEVAAELDVPQHVLRFWESRFAQVKPLKRGGGRRYYRPEDIELLRSIRGLLYGDGYTIRGVQKLLREGGVKLLLAGNVRAGADGIGAKAGAKSAPRGGAKKRDGGGLDDGRRREIASVLDELTALRKILQD